MPIADQDRIIEVLHEDECRRLLTTAAIGRIAYTEGALPAIQPVHFTVHDGQILIPTRLGSKVAAASRGAVVAFEVDGYDAGDRTGWNVTVIGASRVIRNPAEVAALDTLGTRAWAPADIRCYIAVSVAVLRGRRIGPRPSAAQPDDASPGHPMAHGIPAATG